MSIAFCLFVALLVAAPAFLFADSLLFRGFLTGSVALALLLIAISVKPGEAGFFTKLVRPYAIAAALIAAVFLLQLVPVPIESWRHPIWLAAEAASGRFMWGSVTISLGDTLIALSRFLAFCGLFGAGAAVSIDRQRAEIILFVLFGICTAVGLILTIHNAGGFIFLGEISSIGPRAVIALAASMAAILSLATLVYAIERYETRHARSDFSQTGHLVALTAAVIGLCVSGLTVLIFMTRAQGIAMLMGLASFVLIVGVRRAGLGRFGLVVPVATLGIPTLLATATDHARSISFRFAADAPAPLTDAVQRIISDLPWLGSGAGSFADILPLYADLPPHLQVAPTTITAAVVEFGWPLTLAFIAIVVFGIVRLTQGALTRGRDSFYTAGAASCMVTALIEAFLDASLLHTTSLILVAAVLGLGVAQSASRTSRAA